MSRLVENYLVVLQEKESVHSGGKVILAAFMSVLTYAGARLAWNVMKEFYSDIKDMIKSTSDDLSYMMDPKKLDDSGLQKQRIANYLMKRQQDEEHSAEVKKTIAITIATTLIVALISKIAYAIYKSKFSAAARACKDYSGLQKKMCMKKIAADAIRERITALEKGIETCQRLSNTPNVCKQEIYAKIRKERNKLAELEK